MLVLKSSTDEMHDWLRRATSDLVAARILLEANPPQPGAALFHRQQAAEKCLKGFLAFHDDPFDRRMT